MATDPQPQTPSEPTYTPEDFKKALDELSIKMGFHINVSPVFFQQDNGTFSIRIVTEFVPNN